MALVFQTDIAWPDDGVERQVIEGAGHQLVTLSDKAESATIIENELRSLNPAAIMTCWSQVSADAIAMPQNLRIVQRVGVGLDNIAVAAATERGCWVANVPDYCVEEVSDHAIALLLDWARGVTVLDRSVKLGLWDPASARLRRVSDLTVGIVGYGRIGRRTAAKLSSFGCKLLVTTRGRVDQIGLEQVSLDELAGRSDVVILHAPLTTETFHLVNRAYFTKIKPGSFLINVSRGPLIDTDELLNALQDGRLSGAGLDVIEGEPSPPLSLTSRPDVVATPHVAFASDASIVELRRRSAEEVVRVLAGSAPLHPCNHPERPS